MEIKEIRLTPNIDIGDLNTKVKNACRFPAGRQQGQGFGSLPVAARSRTRRLVRICSIASRSCAPECSTVEKQPKLEGRQMLMFLAPAKDKVKPTRRYKRKFREEQNLMPKIKTHSGAKEIFRYQER